jgi:phosphoribosylanthranilate isomerase
MTWVKICGMTNLEDALVAVDAGADAVGFVFYEKSPRNITVEAAREIVKKLPENVEKVGVIVDSHPADFLAVIHETGLTSCQWYLAQNNESPAMPKNSEFFTPPAGFKLYRAVPASWFIEDEARMRDFAASFIKVEKRFISPEQGKRVVERFRTVFLDSGTPQQPGGTGKVFDWQIAAGVIKFLQQTVRVVVAGGLTPENVAEAIGILKPWGVDVASGVEARPGKKDPEKVRAFVKAVRDADRKAS